ncbi:MAG: choice-of-anchor tandem repeat NxxGxxAF-containing protein [Phycisphaerales bacterium]|nr:MAG: hypothetical protein IPK69_05090 [Phycisphaerales bacterium]
MPFRCARGGFRRGIPVVGVALWSGVAIAADTDVVYRPIVLSGQPVPGQPASVVFNSFDVTNNSFSWDTGPAMNANGDLAFRAEFREGFMLAGTGIIARLGSTIQTVARDQVVAPGTGVGYWSFLPPILNENGHLAFKARLLSGPFVTDYGIWTTTSGALALGAREGDPAPGTGADYGDLDPQVYSLYLNNNAHIAFDAALAGTGVTATNDHAIFSDNFGSIALLAREGEQIPGRPAGVVHADDGAFIEFGFNDPGDVVFVTRLSGPGITSTVSDSAIFHAGTAAESLLLQASEPLPGVLAPGVSRIIFSDVRIDTAGQAIFLASFREPPSNIVRVGVFAGSFTAGLRLLAADGEPAPGTGTTYATQGAFSNLAMSDTGRIAFEARLANGDRAIFTDLSGSLTMLVRTGQHPPGTPAGSAFNFFQRATLNNQGRIALPAAVTIPGSPAANGVWMTDAGGALHQIIRAGDTIDIDPDPATTDARVVADFAFRSTPASSGLSDSNEIAIGVRFRDPDTTGFLATAVLVASLATPCIADVDDGTGSGTPDAAVTIDDLLYYLTIFATGDIAADVDNGTGTATQDGAVTIDDLLYYIQRFQAGC